MNFLIYVVNVSSRRALTHEFKSFEVPFLSTDDPRFLWLKYQILRYFEDWLVTTEVKDQEYMKSQRSKK